MKPAATTAHVPFPVTEPSVQPAKCNTTPVTPSLKNNEHGRITQSAVKERQVEAHNQAFNSMKVSQLTRYEKSTAPHINCPDSPLTNALLCIRNPHSMNKTEEMGLAGISLYTNTEYLKLLFEIFQPHQNFTDSYRTIQTNDVHHPLKLIDITAPASLEANSIAEAVYLCTLHLLASSPTETKLQDEIAHYDLDKCLQIMIAIDYLTASVSNPHTQFVMDKILEKIEQDWVATINQSTLSELNVLTNPDGKKLVRLFAASTDHKRDWCRISDTETHEEDDQKPTPMDREQLTGFVAGIKDTLSRYTDSLNPVRRVHWLLAQLFHLLDHKDIIGSLSQNNEYKSSHTQPIEYHSTCPQWLLKGREFGDAVLDDLGYFVIPPFGDYMPIYEYYEDYDIPEPFASLSVSNDIFEIYSDKMEDTHIEVRAYTHPTKAGYSIMCLSKNKS